MIYVSTFSSFALCLCPIGIAQRHRSHSGSLSPTNPQFNVLVVLEGPSDHTTAVVFQDIAHTVQGGLHTLGYSSRVVYCANLVVDGCFVDGERLIVLAPHNLASYDLDGRSAVLERQLLPPDAGTCVRVTFCPVHRNDTIIRSTGQK